MSNIPPNPYNNVPGQHHNANPVPQHQYGQVPSSHPPGIKQDANSNSPVPLGGYNATLANHFNQSASSSPAFNQPGVPPQPTTLRPSPIHPPMKPTVTNPSQIPMQNIPQSSASSGAPSVTSSSSPYPPGYQQRQINDNAPPLVPSSQYNLVNGPQGPMTGSGVSVANQNPVSSNSFNPTSLASKLQGGPGLMNPPFNQRPPLPQTSMPAGLPPGGPPGLPRNSPLIPPTSSSLGPGPNLGPPTSGPPIGPQRILNGPGSNMQGPMRPPMPGQALGHSVPGQGMVQPLSGQGMGPPVSVQGMGPPVSGQGMGPPVSGQGMGPPVSVQGMGPPVSVQGMGPPVSGQGMGPPVSVQGMGPPVSVQGMGPPVSGQGMGPPVSGQGMGPPVSGQGMAPPLSSQGLGPPVSAQAMGPSITGQLMGQPMSGPGMRPPVSAPGMGLPVSAPGMGPPVSAPGMAKGPVRGPPSGASSQGYVNQSNGPPTSAPQMGPGFPYNSKAPAQGGTPNQPTMQQVPPQQPPMGQQMPPAPQMGPKSNMQNRYPQTQQPSYPNHQAPAGFGKQYPQYSTQQLNQQMGQLSVTKQGFDQLWGHHMIDLLQCKHILPEYPEEPQEIKLAHFPDAVNCSPDIFRCTVNRIPDTSSLLQKSRLPLGLLIHPFKDLNHLPVIQCSSIVRCRACRTYINPFVYFVDAKRWKCNLCYRVNELPEEFQYDPVSQSYGDPTRRPEIKSATIEFIAPAEYMLRPPQPAVYLFLFDVSQIARDSGYLQVVCDTLKNSLEQLPGDARTQLGFVCYDAHVHYYLMSDGVTRPKEMTVLDIDEIFLPSPESLLVNLGEYKEMIRELLTVLPQRHAAPGAPVSALGAALQAAYKLLAPTGGRITVFQTCLPNIGPGALQSREDPNARSSKEVAHLNPATDFYKRLALDCSGAQVAVDLFLLSSQYCDLATLSGMSKFSAGTVYHIPLFRAARSWQAEQLTRMFTRYLTRKIGFEAVMRVRCTRGITIHTFHGNLFVRSTDLLSLPNVSPDAGFGLQLTIDESLSDLQQVCFQAALLYTSSKGERRIRVHTLALPIASNLTDVLHSADTACIVGLLSKMAVDRSASASMSEAREALMNVAVDALSAHRLAQNLPVGAVSSALHAPTSLKLLPLYLLALLKRKAFRTGTSTRLDERVADMCAMKCLPLAQLLRLVYPDLYPIHNLHETTHAVKQGDDEDIVPDPPRLHLTAERININGAYLLDDGETMIIYICHGVSPAFLSECWGVAAHSQVADEARSLPRVDSVGNALLHAFVDKLNDDRPYASNLLVLKDNSPSRQLFVERLVDDRVESAFSYYEFLQHVKTQVK